MASTKVLQRSFTGGEISPQMYGRIDDAKYQAGLEICRNFVVLPQGPVENRAGFAYVNHAKYSNKKCRLIPFTFNSDQTMVIELGDKYARFHTQGKTLMNGDEPYEIKTPWTSADVFDVHYVQSADVVTLVHPAYAPVELRRYSLTDWRIEKLSFNPTLSAPTEVKAERNAKAADDKNENNYTFEYRVSSLNTDKTAESEASKSVPVVANLYAYGTTVKISWNAVAGASWYRVYKNQGGLYGYIGDTDGTSIIDDNIKADTSITPRRYDDVFKQAKGIISATVTNGGSGYWPAGIAPLPKNFLETFKDKCRTDRYKFKHDEAGHHFNPSITYKDGALIIQSGWESGSFSGSLMNPEIAIVDGDHPKENGPGSGADVSWKFTRSTESREGYTSDETYTEYRYTVKITSVTVNNSGTNYKKPYLRIRFDFARSKDWWYDRILIPLEVVESPTCNITDTTGFGGEVTLGVADGKIVSATVRSGGRGYTNPQAHIYSASGAGASIRLQVGDAGDYPAAVGYFEQRRCFAGMRNDPQRIVMSRSATESDFSYSLPTRDEDRISYAIAVTQFNQIRHIIPLSQLLLLTSGAEVRIDSLNSDSLTPTSFSARTQAAEGASNVQPVMVNNNLIYCSARGGHVREFAYQYQAGGFVTSDLCLRAPHLFDFKTIQDQTFSKAPVPMLWFVSSDGTLLGLTYIASEGVGAWHQHQTDGAFESCACVAEGDEDVLYCVVRRDNQRFIERMAKRNSGSQSDAFFVDCGGTYRGNPTTIVSGLTWLEGKTVSILADGAVLPQQIVSDGRVNLEVPASVVHVGLPYTSDLKTLPCVLNDSSYGSARQKNVTKVYLRVYRSSGIQAGHSFDDIAMVEYKQRKAEQPGDPAELVTGEIPLQLKPSWTDSGQICVRQEDPLPVTIQAVTGIISA